MNNKKPSLIGIFDKPDDPQELEKRIIIHDKPYVDPEIVKITEEDKYVLKELGGKIYGGLTFGRYDSPVPRVRRNVGYQIDIFYTDLPIIKNGLFYDNHTRVHVMPSGTDDILSLKFNESFLREMEGLRIEREVAVFSYRNLEVHINFDGLR